MLHVAKTMCFRKVSNHLPPVSMKSTHTHKYTQTQCPLQYAEL